MIWVVTDEVEPWFKYIWDQFAKINSLNTESRIATYSDYLLTSPNHTKLLIEYGVEQKLANGLFIPKRKKSKSDDYVWVDDDLPVYRDTIEDGTRSNLYDIFYNAFVHLSRLEDWQSEKKGRYIHSYSFNHPRKNKEIWKIPVVNSLFSELEKWIKRKYPEVSFGDRSGPIIEFSHDVDYISKTIQLRVKQPFFNFLKCSRHLLQWSFIKAVSDFKNGVSFACGNCDYWCFDRWTRLEKKLDIKSV